MTLPCLTALWTARKQQTKKKTKKQKMSPGIANAGMNVERPVLLKPDLTFISSTEASAHFPFNGNRPDFHFR